MVAEAVGRRRSAAMCGVTLPGARPEVTGPAEGAIDETFSYYEQGSYVPDREDRSGKVLDSVEVVCGSARRIPDLADGIGSIIRRMLDRFDQASTSASRDPVALTKPPSMAKCPERRTERNLNDGLAIGSIRAIPSN
jgi:hypothetical protein